MFASFDFGRPFRSGWVIRVHFHALEANKVNALGPGCEFHKNWLSFVGFTEVHRTSVGIKFHQDDQDHQDRSKPSPRDYETKVTAVARSESN